MVSPSSLQFLATEPALETVGIVRWPAQASAAVATALSRHTYTLVYTTLHVYVIYGISRHARYVPFQCMAAMLCCASHTMPSRRFCLSRFSFVQHREINSNAKPAIVSVPRRL